MSKVSSFILLYKQFFPIVIVNTTAIGGIIGNNNNCLEKGIATGVLAGITYPIALPICCWKLLFP